HRGVSTAAVAIARQQAATITQASVTVLDVELMARRIQERQQMRWAAASSTGAITGMKRLVEDATPDQRRAENFLEHVDQAQEMGPVVSPGEPLVYDKARWPGDGRLRRPIQEASRRLEEIKRIIPSSSASVGLRLLPADLEENAQS